MDQGKEVGIREIPRADKWLLFSLQHLFAMFGATVLVPFLVDLSPATALLTSGLGTLAYLLVTKGQIPAYLGSSFAFIIPIQSAQMIGGMEGAMVGAFLAGLVYGVVALIIKAIGVNWLMKILPPIVVGPVIMVIGLSLAGSAVNQAMYTATSEYSVSYLMTALVTLGITIIATMFFRGFFGLVPILFGLIGGYSFAYFQGLVDTSGIAAAAWFSVPDLIVPFVTYTPSFSWSIAFIMVPVAVVTLSEHIGQQMVISKVAGRNFIKKPGLHRSILGDGVATVIAAGLGGPPNTTYGENIGVMTITRVFSVFVIGGAAVLAITFSFIGKISALISSIPSPVMGGVSILLFGIIASSGLRMLIDNGINIGEKRNLIISSVILVLGIGGAFIQVNESVQIPGMAVAAIVGIFLHLVLPNKEQSYGQSDMFAEMTTDLTAKETK